MDYIVLQYRFPVYGDRNTPQPRRSPWPRHSPLTRFPGTMSLRFVLKVRPTLAQRQSLPPQWKAASYQVPLSMGMRLGKDTRLGYNSPEQRFQRFRYAQQERTRKPYSLDAFFDASPA